MPVIPEITGRERETEREREREWERNQEGKKQLRKKSWRYCTSLAVVVAVDVNKN